MGRAPLDVGGNGGNQRRQNRLDDVALRSLHDQSNGWVAGLVLMLERLRRTGAVSHISQSETMDTVFDYFAGQIFDQSPVGTRDFLMRTACLPNVTVKAALQISGNPDAAKHSRRLVPSAPLHRS